MPGYRFCRTDDVPLLVDACNACCLPHEPPAPPFTLERYKSLVRELNLWASSCMLAMEGSRPIGVMLAARRDHATLIHTLAVHPDHIRRGHGSHLLKSLSSKLAILGPPRLVAEVPEDRADLRAFLEACGYRPEWEAADFVLDGRPPTPPPPMAAPVTFDDLMQAGLIDASAPRAWQRRVETLANRGDQLQGLALASDAGTEAWVLFRREPGDAGRLEAGALGCAGTAQAGALLAILLHHLAGREPGGVSLPAVTAAEADPALLASWGFRRTRGLIGYAARATPA